VSTSQARHLSATGSSTVAELLRGEVRPAVVLGAFPTALYLRLAGGEVVAVLARDAVRLPLGLRLTTPSSDLPLDRWTGPVLVGASYVETAEATVGLSRIVSVSAPAHLEPDPRTVAYAADRLPELGLAEPLPLPELYGGLTGDRRAAEAVVRRLLGVGPGLTPSGDDVLAGVLVAAWSFGLVAGHLRTAVLGAAPGGTTDLSAALLRCAARGETIPQVSALVSALSDRTDARRLVEHPLSELGQVGHTSGVALAAGVIAAAQAGTRVRGYLSTHGVLSAVGSVTPSPGSADAR
jgi:hypothetical protein